MCVSKRVLIEGVYCILRYENIHRARKKNFRFSAGRTVQRNKYFPSRKKLDLLHNKAVCAPDNQRERTLSVLPFEINTPDARKLQYVF